MKFFRKPFSVIFLSMFFFIGLKIYSNFNISKNIKNEEKEKLIDSAEILNHCFDLKNKSQRSLNDSMKLLEFCLKEYKFEK